MFTRSLGYRECCVRHTEKQAQAQRLQSVRASNVKAVVFGSGWLQWEQGIKLRMLFWHSPAYMSQRTFLCEARLYLLLDFVHGFGSARHILIHVLNPRQPLEDKKSTWSWMQVMHYANLCDIREVLNTSPIFSVMDPLGSDENPMELMDRIMGWSNSVPPWRFIGLTMALSFQFRVPEFLQSAAPQIIAFVHINRQSSWLNHHPVYVGNVERGINHHWIII